ncbi:efflux RND transporter periplasmic adaptor subunit [Lutibacter flavus]|uniref:RND family efflux transporter, MFP subunit n=1 Tax=Lutibacter flavus TaxID=691689 RepID=A0A238YD65_9FLAO|nr:efflux RND transporter periplasmic adaptor subunit [Lutibacter flavus]SNR69196.1 RND family efflux transporter, MFP subunit [Lutibacter flavus]
MKKYLIIVLALTAIACKQNNEDNHAHNPDGSHVGEEIPRMDYTIWTDQTELFVEFPVLIVGQPSKFAAHFTVMDGHQPVREGSVTVSLIKGDKGIRATGESPSSPGIFSPIIQPKEAGIHQLVFDLSTPQYTDKIVIKDVMVYANLDEANKAIDDAGDDGSISFLKEQAWKIDFQTAPVIKGEIYDVINTSGVWTPAQGSVKTLVATANGTVNFATTNLTEGTEVKQGQLLMNVSSKGLTSNNLSAEIAKAKANYDQATSEYDRKKELYESKIIPKSEFEKVESNYNIAKSQYQSLALGVSDGSKQIRAPFNGFIRSVNIANGDYAEQGTVLISVATEQSKVLKSQIAPTYGLTMQNIKGVWYQTEEGQWKSIRDSEGEILSISKDIEHNNPLISVYAQVNDPIKVPNGSLTQVQIAMGNAIQNTMIPVNALLEDYGSYSVMVQLSGESFERRPVKIGKRNGKNVEILQGLKVGEVVVTIGAYQVKMASMSGSTPAHGHEH